MFFISNKTFIIFITILIFVGALFINQVQKDKSSSSSPEAQSAPEKYEYFWSETCPHCTNVAEFLNGWEGKDNIQMDKFEVKVEDSKAIILSNLKEGPFKKELEKEIKERIPEIKEIAFEKLTSQK